MSGIIFPIRRVDGGIITGGGGALPSNPTFQSLDITGDTLKVNGIEMQWPIADGTIGQVLTTDGNNPATLTFSNPPVSTISHRREDTDTNTSIEVDLPATGLDNTIRLTNNGVETITISETATTIKNNFSLGEVPLTTVTTVTTPLNYTVNFGPVHIIKDAYMYFVAGTDMIIVDISNTTPTIVSTTTLGFINPSSIKISGNYAYIGEQDRSSSATNSYIVNITDPTSPTLDGTFPQVDVSDLQIQGNIMYSSDYSQTTTTKLIIGGFEWNTFSTGNPTSILQVVTAQANNSNLWLISNVASGEIITFPPAGFVTTASNAAWVSKMDVEGNWTGITQSTGTNQMSTVTGFGGKSIGKTSDNGIVTLMLSSVTGTAILSPINLGTIASTAYVIGRIDPDTMDYTWARADNSAFVGVQPQNITTDSQDNILLGGDYIDLVGAQLPGLPGIPDGNPIVSVGGAFVAKLSADSTTYLWQNIIVSPSNNFMFTKVVVIDSIDNVYAICDNSRLSTPSGQKSEIVIAKYNSAGVFQWQSVATVPSVPTTNRIVMASNSATVNSDNSVTILVYHNTTITATPLTSAATTGAISMLRIDTNGIWINIVPVEEPHSSVLFSNAYNMDITSQDFNIISGGFPSGSGIPKMRSYDTSLIQTSQFDFSYASPTLESNIWVTVDQRDRIFIADVDDTGPGRNVITFLMDPGSKNIKITNISNSTSPEILSITPIDESINPEINSILVKDAFMYVTTNITGDQSLYVYNISDSTNITQLLKLPLNTIVDDYVYTSLRTSGNYLFAHGVNKSGTSNTHGVVSLNITDPAVPIIADTYSISNSISSIAFNNYTMANNGKYLYVIDDIDNLLTILNISDPNNMTSFTTVTLTSPLGINLIGRYLYVMETPNMTLTVYNYSSSFYQHLDTGTLYTSNLTIDGPLNVKQQLQIGQGLLVSKGLFTQTKSSITGTLNVVGTVKQTEFESSVFRQVTGVAPSTTLDQDHILNMAHTGTAVVSLLPAADDKGAEYVIIKENANPVTVQVDPTSNDLLYTPGDPVTVTLDYSVLGSFGTGGESNLDNNAGEIVASSAGSAPIYQVGDWPAGASTFMNTSFDISEGPIAIVNTNPDRTTWISGYVIGDGFKVVRIIEGTAFNVGRYLTIDSNNQPILFGYGFDNGSGDVLTFDTTTLNLTGPNSLPWIGKFDPTGVYIVNPFPNPPTLGIWEWAVQFENPGFNGINTIADITTDSDDNIYAMGRFSLASYSISGLPALTKVGVEDIYIVKLDSSGTFISSFSIGIVAKTLEPRALRVNSAGDIYVLYDESTLLTTTIQKYNNLFTLLISTDITSTVETGSSQLELVNDTDVVIAGYYSDDLLYNAVLLSGSSTPSPTDKWNYLIKIQPIGVGYMWHVVPDNGISTITEMSEYVDPVKLTILPNGTIVMTGRFDPGVLKFGTVASVTNSNGASISDAYTVALTTNGLVTDLITGGDSLSSFPTPTGITSQADGKISTHYNMNANNYTIFGNVTNTPRLGTANVFAYSMVIESFVFGPTSISMVGATNEQLTVFSNGSNWYKTD